MLGSKKNSKMHLGSTGIPSFSDQGED